MKIHLLFVCIGLLLPVVHSGSKSEFDAVLASTARKCRKTFQDCLHENPDVDQIYKNGHLCDMFFNGTVHSSYFFHCLVSIGLCTEDEFDLLIGEACDVITDLLVSPHKDRFYKSIDITSEKCQDQIMYCINISSVATVIKQEEEFCNLFKLDINGISSSSCLLAGCSRAEILVLNVTACFMNDEHEEWKTGSGFSDVILITSPLCKASMEDCVEESSTARYEVRNTNYCNVMQFVEGDRTAHMCLVDEGNCTEIEFKLLEGVACADSVVQSLTSQVCLNSINHCVGMSILAQIYIQYEEFCELFDMKFNGVTAYQCMVNLGFCTPAEYNLMAAVYCKDYSELNIELSHFLLYRVLGAASQACQSNVLDCISHSIIATLLKTDNQFCELMTLSTNGNSAYTCLSQCSYLELALIQTISCNTSLTYPPSPFTKSVLSTSQKCKDTIEQCAFGSSLAFSSIQSGDYCQLMNVYQNGAVTYACLVGSGGCTDSEYGVMTDAACGSGCPTNVYLAKYRMQHSLLIIHFHRNQNACNTNTEHFVHHE
ncbi:hypothetical protein Btru_050277 [Bulinus truncatus]|nr:hypothetical protein Btru_050277 [Bulinus truncatus]